MYYILDGDHNVVATSDMERFEIWHEDIRNRRVGYTELPDDRQISTVFLGVNHNLGNDGPPLFFETMIFGSGVDFLNQYCERCSTWAQALAQHDEAVEWAIAHPDGERDEPA